MIIMCHYFVSIPVALYDAILIILIYDLDTTQSTYGHFPEDQTALRLFQYYHCQMNCVLSFLIYNKGWKSINQSETHTKLMRNK